MASSSLKLAKHDLSGLFEHLPGLRDVNAPSTAETSQIHEAAALLLEALLKQHKPHELGHQ